MLTPPWFWPIVALVFGVSIGSFLNVVIWRLPRGESLIYPQHSYCPHCKAQLQAIDLVPLVSFVALRATCRRCHAPISWRYFSVELLTGALFVAVALWYAHDLMTGVAMALFVAALVPIFFIDLATFTIPSSLNLFAFVVALGRDVVGIVNHEPGHALVGGWLPVSILGALLGVLIFGVVRVAGWLGFRKEAMGLGDVLLARAIGAMLPSIVAAGMNPLRLFPIWFFLSILSGLVVGPLLIWIRRRTSAVDGGGEAEPDLENEEPSTLMAQLKDVGYCLVFLDAVEYVWDLLQRMSGRTAAAPAPEEEYFEPAPTAIPFGPFMVIGFLAAAAVGEALTAAYLNYVMHGAY